jgi:hypothetical protein
MAGRDLKSLSATLKFKNEKLWKKKELKAKHSKSGL